MPLNQQEVDALNEIIVEAQETIDLLNAFLEVQALGVISDDQVNRASNFLATQWTSSLDTPNLKLMLQETEDQFVEFFNTIPASSLKDSLDALATTLIGAPLSTPDTKALIRSWEFVTTAFD